MKAMKQSRMEVLKSVAKPRCETAMKKKFQVHSIPKSNLILECCLTESAAEVGKDPALSLLETRNNLGF